MRVPRLGLTLAAFLVAPAGVRAQISADEARSVIIERFTRFIEWPPASLPLTSPFVVCIQGNGGTGDRLDSMARERKFKDRTCEVRRLRAGSDVSGCHLLYIAPSEGPRLAELVSAANGKAILTVGDTPGFALRGVLINVFQEQRPTGRYLGFEINMTKVKSSKLTWSSKLLRLGRLVAVPPDDPAR
jgi:YfiR/HmsC-like